MANCAVCGTEFSAGAGECPACGSPPSGQLIIAGKYKLTRVLGRGGVGTVHLAVDLALDRPCAVKMLRPTVASEAAAVQRLEKEAKVLARLEHPNVVPIYAVDRYNGVPFIVMKHLEGKTLARLTRERGRPWTVSELTPMLRQLCAGLGFIHSKGVVHRDLKPGNLFVSPQGHLTILDLGVARTFDSTLTRPGLSLGTPHYMSPEQTTATPIDARSDLYSLGVIVFEALTGRLPFLGESPFEQMRAHREEPAPDASIFAPVPRDIGRLLQRLLSKAPGDRCQTAEELSAAWDAAAARDERAIVADLPTEHHASPRSAHPPVPPKIAPVALRSPAPSADALPRASPGGKPPASGDRGAPGEKPRPSLADAASKSTPGEKLRNLLADATAKSPPAERPRPSLADAASKSTPGEKLRNVLADATSKSTPGVRSPIPVQPRLAGSAAEATGKAAPVPKALGAPAPAQPNYGDDDEGATFLVSPSMLPGMLGAGTQPQVAARPSEGPIPQPMGTTTDETNPGRRTVPGAGRPGAPPGGGPAEPGPSLVAGPSYSTRDSGEVQAAAPGGVDYDATNLLTKDMMSRALAHGVATGGASLTQTGETSPAQTIEGGPSSEPGLPRRPGLGLDEPSAPSIVTQRSRRELGEVLEALAQRPWVLVGGSVLLALLGFLVMAAIMRA